MTNNYKKPLRAALLALVPLAVQADPAVPNAGSILQQIQPVTPPKPSSSGNAPIIQGPDAVKLPDSAPFEVKTVRISGNEVIDTGMLHTLVADAEGKRLTLSQLGDLADRITEYYHWRGYPLARAYIPAQSIESGVVRIEVIEAKYDKIQLDNLSGVDAGLLRETLGTLHGGQIIDQPGLDHALLLLSDIPGVTVNSTLKPGGTVGTSDLQVVVDTAQSVTGNVFVDDYGNRYTGRERLGGSVNWFNPLHHGDLLSLTGLTAGSGLNYQRLSYEMLTNGSGTRLGAAYSALDYHLNGTLSASNSNGTAQISSAWVQHPLVRSLAFNLNLHAQYDHSELHDRTSALKTYRHVDAGSVSLSGDTLAGPSFTTWSLGWTGGHVGFDDPTAQAYDRLTLKTEGRFSKWNASLSRQQWLSPKDSLFLAFTGQWTRDNLDSSRKMIAGGPDTVRGYDMGAVSGDSGYIGTAEIRHDLGSGQFGQFHAVGFIDSARVTINQHPTSSDANRVTLSSVGAGVTWLAPNQSRASANPLNARIFVATPVGSVPALLGKTNNARVWLEIGMGF